MLVTYLETQPHWTFREELTVEDGIVLKSTCIVIPHKKCQATLQLIHEGHLGLGKCKFRAKDTVYWPGLNDQLEKLILNCELCLKYSHSKCKQKPSTSLGQKIPVHPWTKLATYIFHFQISSYLLLVDYTCRSPVVHMLSSMRGQQVANQYKLIFSEYRWPEILISENAHMNNITSSPYYPQSSGLAGKYVHIVKSLFYKAKEESKDFLPVSYHISQYPTYRLFVITYADFPRQEC